MVLSSVNGIPYRPGEIVEQALPGLSMAKLIINNYFSLVFTFLTSVVSHKIDIFQKYN